MELMEMILSKENMEKAIKSVKSNKGAPGVDKMTVNEIDDYFNKHMDEIDNNKKDINRISIIIKTVDVISITLSRTDGVSKMTNGKWKKLKKKNIVLIETSKSSIILMKTKTKFFCRYRKDI